MRIGIVCPYSFDYPGGVQAHIIDVAGELIDRGHHVRVIGPARSTVDLPDFVIRGGQAWPVRYNGSVARLACGPLVWWRTHRFINRGEFDVVHIHEPNAPSYSLVALIIAQGPIVATYHASSASSFLLRLARRVLAPYLEKIRGGIAVSEMARRWQVTQVGGDPVLIPNGVDIQRFRRQRRLPSTKEAREVEIVFLGRLDEPRKGLDVLLDALAQVHAVTPFRVTVIGDGHRRPFPGVSYVGRVSEAEKAEILGRADIYVAPNTGGESFGIVLVEAMAAGCAVIASDLEAFVDVCQRRGDTPAAELFATGDAGQLAHALTTMIDNPQLRATLVERGDRRCEDFDWHRVTDDIERIYETVADGTTVRTGWR